MFSKLSYKLKALSTLEIIYPVFICLCFFWVYSFTFNSSLNLGGDNAAYYLLGKSLSTGQGYSSIQSFNSLPATHFPPGYSLLISIEMFLFSDSVNAIKYLNGFFLLCAALTLFAIVKNFTSNIHFAFISVLFLFSNFHVLQYSSIMMSEIPFLFFSLLILYHLMKINFVFL